MMNGGDDIKPTFRVTSSRGLCWAKALLDTTSAEHKATAFAKFLTIPTVSSLYVQDRKSYALVFADWAAYLS